MERNGKHIAKEATNGIIYDSAGQIVHNGLLEICPFCGEMNNHFGSGGSVNIWTVGAIERRECTKCRKQFHKISLTVPPDETPEAVIISEDTNLPEEVVEEEVVPESAPDPNHIMTPDEIAALLGETESVIEEEPVKEEKAPMPDLSNPNHVMTPEEIAALLANM